ncbi:MAG: hypothetical protein OXH99_25885 [Bryobacterales bacterium]|nr:hypothetical protein [Bryobacterales bacterium]
MERRFEACEPNRLWVADITCVTTQEGFLCLAMVLDVSSLRVVGWVMGARKTAVLARSAFDAALKARAAKDAISRCLRFGGYCESLTIPNCLGVAKKTSLFSIGYLHPVI